MISSLEIFHRPQPGSYLPMLSYSKIGVVLAQMFPWYHMVHFVSRNIWSDSQLCDKKLDIFYSWQWDSLFVFVTFAFFRFPPTHPTHRDCRGRFWQSSDCGRGWGRRGIGKTFLCCELLCTMNKLESMKLQLCNCWQISKKQFVKNIHHNHADHQPGSLLTHFTQKMKILTPGKTTGSCSTSSAECWWVRQGQSPPHNNNWWKHFYYPTITIMQQTRQHLDNFVCVKTIFLCFLLAVS